MVILADELLQQFFEFSFAESIHLSPPTVGRSPSSFSLQTPTLTTFTNLHGRHIFASTPVTPPAPTTPSKGLRGLLDNIVTDGMRVAAEVRKRVDDAQRELERSALGRDDEYEDEEEDARTPGLNGADAERRSVRERDRDLLDGAEVGSIRELADPIEPATARKGSGEEAVVREKILELET
jgi:hypothetical protein